MFVLHLEITFQMHVTSYSLWKKAAQSLSKHKGLADVKPSKVKASKK